MQTVDALCMSHGQVHCRTVVWRSWQECSGGGEGCRRNRRFEVTSGGGDGYVRVRGEHSQHVVVVMVEGMMAGIT